MSVQLKWRFLVQRDREKKAHFKKTAFKDTYCKKFHAFLDTNAVKW